MESNTPTVAAAQSQTPAQPEASAGQQPEAPEFHQASFDRGFGKAKEQAREQEKAHAAELEKLKTELADTTRARNEAIEWRLKVLQGRAEAVHVPKSVADLAQSKDLATFESIIAEFETRAKNDAARQPAPQPAPQPGGQVSGGEGPAINLDMIDPTRNPHGIAAAYREHKLAVAKYGQAAVNKMLVERASR